MHTCRGEGYESILVRGLTYIRLLLRTGIKVANEWQISLDYVRGSNIYVRGYLDLTMGRRFFLHEKDTFPPLNQRNTRDKAKGLCVTSERYIGV